MCNLYESVISKQSPKLEGKLEALDCEKIVRDKPI